MNISSVKFIVLSCLSFSTLTAETIYESIARINSSTLIQKQEQKRDALNDLMSRTKRFHEVVSDNLNEQLNPNPQTKRQAIFSLLSAYEKQHSLATTNTCMDQTTWHDLELLCGSKEAPMLYLADKLDRTRTGMGQAVFYRKLVQPLTNYQELVNQQEIIKELVANQQLFDELDAALKELVTPENAFISFWSDTFFASMFCKEGYQPPFADKIAWIKKLAQWCDKQELVVEANAKLSDIKHFTWLGACTAGAITLPLAGMAQITRYPVPSQLTWINNKLGLGAMSMFTIGGALLYLLSFTPNKRYQGYSDVAAGSLSSLSIYQSIESYKTSCAVGNSIKAKITHVAQYVTTINQLMNSLKKNNSIIQRIPAIQQYDALITKLSQSKDIAHLFKLLHTNTFQKNKLSWLLSWGRTYVAYRLLMSIKDELVPLMLTIGELDSYLSVARLYKEFQEKSTTFCFPIYNQNTQAPFITIKEFWHPMLNQQVTVANSITIGHAQAPNIIITGPNAGGKSTTAKALTLAIILAQSLGIAPAQELTFTPYTHIITYLNITDDIAIGNSHFMAEAQRARDLINTAQNAAKNNTYSLTISDEIFNGTTYKEGQAAAYCLIDTLGIYKNNTCITCTHFPRLTQLEKNRNFANYKVSIAYNNHGLITYPYKLEPGITNQIVTFDILREKGFDDEFLKQAKKSLASFE